MRLSTLLALAGNLAGVGPLAWAAIRRMAASSARMRTPKPAPATPCFSFESAAYAILSPVLKGIIEKLS